MLIKPAELIIDLEYRSETFEEKAGRMKAPEIRALLHERGLSTIGSRDELLQRIILNKDVEPLPRRHIELRSLRLDSLKDILRGYALRLTGSKKILIQRILDHEEDLVERDEQDAVGMRDEETFEIDLEF